METFIVECRYETLTHEGKKFTNWFVYDSDKMSESECNEKIKYAKDTFGYIDKKTKLKHEFRLKSYDEYLNESKMNETKAKESIEEREKYLKSDAYKELQKKKRQSAKERKERQKKYLENQ